MSSKNMTFEEIKEYAEGFSDVSITKENIFEEFNKRAAYYISYPTNVKEINKFHKFIPEYRENLFNTLFIKSLKNLCASYSKYPNLFKDICDIIKIMLDKSNYEVVDIKDITNIDTFSGTIFNNSYNPDKYEIDMSKDTMRCRRVFDFNGRVFGIELIFLPTDLKVEPFYNFNDMNLYTDIDRIIMDFGIDKKGNAIFTGFVYYDFKLFESILSYLQMALYNTITELYTFLNMPSNNKGVEFFESRTKYHEISLRGGLYCDGLSIQRQDTYAARNAAHLAFYGIICKELNNMSSREYLEFITDFYESQVKKASVNNRYYQRLRNKEDFDEPLPEKYLDNQAFYISLVKYCLERLYNINQ